MRKNFLVALAALVLTSTASLAQEADKKEKTRIEGSGNVVTREVSVQSFDQLDISGVFSVLLTQGTKEQVKIEADDNLQPLFDVKNEGDKLVIKMKKESNFNSKTKLKVYVTFKKLKNLDLKTVGDVSSAETLSFDNLALRNKSVGNVDLKLTAQSLNVENKSVGSVKFRGKAESVQIKNNSVGSIHAADFVVQRMDIDNSGVGSAEVNAEKELKVKDNMLGKVTNKGAATPKRANKTVI